MVIAIIGPSGSGKGTQAKILAEKLSVPSVSLGEIMRAEKEAGTALGLKLAQYTDRGQFVPSQLLADLLSQRLANSDCHQGFILDGTPRKMEDIKLLEAVLAAHSQALDLVIHLDTSQPTTLSRIQQRVYATLERGETVRADETLEAVKNRLAEYNQRIDQIMTYYQKQGKLVRVDNEGGVEEVAEAIWDQVYRKLNYDQT